MGGGAIAIWTLFRRIAFHLFRKGSLIVNDTKPRRGVAVFERTAPCPDRRTILLCSSIFEIPLRLRIDCDQSSTVHTARGQSSAVFSLRLRVPLSLSLSLFEVRVGWPCVLSRHSSATCQGNWLTRKSSGKVRPQ